MASVLVVSASYDKQIRIWDAATGRTVKSFVFEDSQINSLFLLPDTGYLAVAGFGVLRLYDLGVFLNSGPRAGSGGLAAAGTNGSQAPPVFSSFESQSSMNFTSIAAVPLHRRGSSEAENSVLSESSRLLMDLGSTVAIGDQLLGTILPDMAGLLAPSAFKDVSTLLVATSEDGRIRFFNAHSATTLRIIKDIATGAAITCSAVSPDRRYLLTGNQMGQVTMWHLPSIVASVAIELKAHKPRGAATATEATSEGVPATEHGTAAAAKLGDTRKAKSAVAAAEEEEWTKSFGRKPLQDIHFADDYSAIRSIAIEPLGRWAAVATNAGKVHFLRLAHDASVKGSKSAAIVQTGRCPGQQPSLSPSAGTGALEQSLTPRDIPPQSLSGSPQPSSYKSAGPGSTGGSQGRVPSPPLPLSGHLGVREGGAVPNTLYNGPRETIYRSALVVSELSSNARRMSDASGEGMSRDTAGAHHISTGGVSPPNSIGAVLLDHLEQHQNSRASQGTHAGAQGPSQPDDGQAQGDSQLALAKLMEELEMETFHTIQAHYNYILRVIIAPTSDLIVTCCADYSVGRFLVPSALRVPSSMISVGDDLDASHKTGEVAANLLATQLPHYCPSGAAEGTPVGEQGNGSKEAGGEVHNDTFGPSAASTQAPVTSMNSRDDSSGDPALQPPGGHLTSNSIDNNAVEVAAAPSPSRSHDGLGSRDLNEGAAESSQSALLDFHPLKPLAGHTRWVWDGVFSDCGNYLFTASSDSTLRMWNGLLSDTPKSAEFVGHTKPVVAVLLYYEKRRHTLRG